MKEELVNITASVMAPLKVVALPLRIGSPHDLPTTANDLFCW